MIPLMTFMQPERLTWLWLLALIGGVYLVLGLRRSLTSRSRNSSALQKLLPKQGRWKRHVAVAMALLSLTMLVIAYARPSGITKVPRERATVIMVLDVSRSMKATDVKPTRLEAVQKQAKDFLTMIPEGFNVALVQFAGTAQLLRPPTTDRAAIAATIDGLQLAPSTAIGEGIHTGLGALALVPPDPKNPKAKVPAVMVLLSDGGTNLGLPSDEAADYAKKLDCPIYSIAYGTPHGTIIDDGEEAPVPVNYAELNTIAKRSGGQYFEADSSEKLRDVYQEIASSVGYTEKEKEITSRYIGWALLCSVIASLGVISIASRWP